MQNLKGKVIYKQGKAYWVQGTQSMNDPAMTNRNTVPTDVKIIQMGKLTREERDVLREAHSYIYLDEYYKNKKFIKCYKKFHESTGGKYLEGGFDKFKVACVQARRIWT